MNSDVLWSHDEINILKENAGVQSIQSIAMNLKRSPHAVRSKLNRLGYTSIRELNGSMSLAELAKALDVSRCVVKRWIEEYDLPANQKKYYYYHTKMVHYSIYPDEFWKWAKAHKHLINFSKIVPYSILPEPEWLDEEKKNDRKKPTRSQKNWTRIEDKTVLILFAEGMTYKQIGAELGRSPRAIQSRLSRLHNR